jgi:transcriptional regulator with XRE-family HTH domain
MPTFGELLKQDRERLQLSQEQLAKMLDVSQQAVANWEAGTSHPRKDRREKLVQVLGPESSLVKTPPRYEFTTANSTTEAGRTVVSIVGPNYVVRTYGHPSPGRLDLQTELTAALPDPLRKHVGGSISYGQQKRDYDYVSHGVVARCIRAANPEGWPHALSVIRETVRLAMAAGRYSHTPEPTASVVLFIISSEHPARVLKFVDAAVFDATILGVTVNVVPDVVAIANTIVELEQAYEQQMREFQAWLEDTRRDAHEFSFDRDDLDPPE